MFLKVSVLFRIFFITDRFSLQNKQLDQLSWSRLFLLAPTKMYSFGSAPLQFYEPDWTCLLSCTRSGPSHSSCCCPSRGASPWRSPPPRCCRCPWRPPSATCQNRTSSQPPSWSTSIWNDMKKNVNIEVEKSQHSAAYYLTLIVMLTQLFYVVLCNKGCVWSVNA